MFLSISFFFLVYIRKQMMKEWSCNIRTNWEVFVWLTCTCWTLWLPFPPPGDLPDRGIEPASLMSPALAGGFFLSLAPSGKPHKRNLKRIKQWRWNIRDSWEVSVWLKHTCSTLWSFFCIFLNHFIHVWLTYKKLCALNIYNFMSWETSIIYSCEITIYAMNISITWLAKFLPTVSIISSLLFCDKNSQDLLS